MQEDPAKLELLRMTYHYEELSFMKEENNLSGMNAALIDFYFFQISNWNPTSVREWSPTVTQEETLVAEFLLPKRSVVHWTSRILVARSMSPGLSEV